MPTDEVRELLERLSVCSSARHLGALIDDVRAYLHKVPPESDAQTDELLREGRELGKEARERWDAALGSPPRSSAQGAREALEGFLYDDTTLPEEGMLHADTYAEALAAERVREADEALVEWSHEAGWATGHGDTLAYIVRELRAQWRETMKRINARCTCIGVDGPHDYCPMHGDMPGMIEELEERLAALERVREAATSLRNEVRAIIGGCERDIREAAGHTNVACLNRRERELSDALAAAPAKREGGE